MAFPMTTGISPGFVKSESIKVSELMLFFIIYLEFLCPLKHSENIASIQEWITFFICCDGAGGGKAF
jgi:hypothetical protein